MLCIELIIKDGLQIGIHYLKEFISKHSLDIILFNLSNHYFLPIIPITSFDEVNMH
jgi:hypothetical protein